MMNCISAPFRALFRIRNWIVLFLLTLSLFGGYAFYDAPGSLAVWLDHDLEISPTRLGLLYSAYSAPIIVFALVCGNLADRYGVNFFMATYQIFTLIGAGIFAMAYSQTEQVAFMMMIISRVISGIGGDGLAIVSRKAVFSWFSESNQSLAITLIMTLPFLGTQFAFICLPVIATTFGGGIAFWTVFATCAISAVFSIIYFMIAKLWPSEWDQVSDDVPLVDETEKPKLSFIRNFVACLFSLPWRFWVLCVVDMFVNGALWPFVAFSPDFFYHHYGFTPEVAGIFATLLAGIAIPLGVIVGFIGGRIPKSIVGMNAASLQIICFLVLAWATEFPCIVAVLGLSLVLASTGTSVYAPVSQMVPRESLGMALGILKSAESISWIITPPLYGAIYEWTHNFAWSCTMFAGMGVVALLLQFVLFVFREKSAPKITELTSVV